MYFTVKEILEQAWTKLCEAMKRQSKTEEETDQRDELTDILATLPGGIDQM